MMAVIFDVDQETRTGLKISNAETAGWVKKYPQTFIGFGSVDPWKGDVGRRGGAAMRRHGAARHEIPAGDPGVRPTNQPVLSDLRGLRSLEPAGHISHGGTTAIGAGTPGGGGLLLEYCRPIPYIDEIAARYPELRIIMAHPAWPWHDEQLAVMRHKGNVYMDLSGWAPKYFPAVDHPERQHAGSGQGLLRLRLPRPDARALAGRIRGASHQGDGPTQDLAAQRGQVPGHRTALRPKGA